MEEKELKRGLKNRHVQLLAIGGALFILMSKLGKTTVPTSATIFSAIVILISVLLNYVCLIFFAFVLVILAFNEETRVEVSAE